MGVVPTGTGWKVSNEDQNEYYSMPPIIYTKVAFGFLALYNSTYARSMVIFLNKSCPRPPTATQEAATTQAKYLRQLTLTRTA